jgi:hypothetical protein
MYPTFQPANETAHYFASFFIGRFSVLSYHYFNFEIFRTNIDIISSQISYSM